MVYTFIMQQLKGIVHLKMKILFFYLPSCHSKPVWIYFVEHKDILKK